jgi:hypothetical protein
MLEQRLPSDLIQRSPPLPQDTETIHTNRDCLRETTPGEAIDLDFWNQPLFCHGLKGSQIA